MTAVVNGRRSPRLQESASRPHRQGREEAARHRISQRARGLVMTMRGLWRPRCAGTKLARSLYTGMPTPITRWRHASLDCASATFVAGAAFAACAVKLEEKSTRAPLRGWFQARSRPWGGGSGWAGDLWERVAPLAHKLSVPAATLKAIPGIWDRLGIIGPLCLVNISVYAAWWLAPARIMSRHFLHTPLSGPRWTLLLAAFSHQTLVHLGLNMWALVSFGASLQERWGAYMFGAVFVSACAFSSAGVSVLAAAVPALAVPGLGASGGVMAMVCASCLVEPNNTVGVPFVPGMSVRAGEAIWYIVGADALGLLAVVLLGVRSPIGHAAHLGGQAFGSWLLLGGGLGLLHETTDRMRNAWRKRRV